MHSYRTSPFSKLIAPWLQGRLVKPVVVFSRVVGLLLLAVLAAGQMAQAQTLMVQLLSTNYNATTGVWTDSSGNGNNATATGTKPTLATGVTPNGSPAVVFNGSTPMGLASSIPVSSYTVLTYIKPATGAGPYAVLGGASGAFEYRIYNSKQDNLRQQQADLGSENTAMSTSAFNVIGTILTSTGVSFRLNGAADGTNAASSALTQPISAIGARASGGGENFSGSICEIDIYSGVLTLAQIVAVEAAFTNRYITIPPTAPIVVSQTTASPTTATVGGNDTLTASFTGAAPISYQWQVSPNSNGSGASSLTGQTNATLVLTNLQLSDSGKFYSLRATNTVAPYSTNSSWLQLTVQVLTPLVQLIATNYSSSGAQWTDSSGNGNDAYYAGTTTPNLATFVTPNGSSAVNVPAGDGSFLLTSPLDPSSGYTVFAYVKPSSTSGRHAITGGSTSGALEYTIYNTNQNYLVEYTADVGIGATNIPTTSFSLIGLAVNSSSAAFRFNGVPDGTNIAGSTFTAPITRIGNNEGGGDGYVGQIAEVDIYNGVLSSIQISNIEAQFTARYVTASSVVVGAATVSPTNNTYAGNAITLSAPIIGANGSTTYRWQTDNGSSGASFANISGATTTNYLLNTTGLLGTYEYQLITTPFGGSSVTSAPVTLTVQAASAPVVSVDTTANPSVATIGGNETFSASFVGTLPISYQWQVSPNANGSGASSLTGQTNATLVLTNLQLSNSGKYYSLRATNTVAPYAANSTWTLLTVQPLTPLVQLIATNYNTNSLVWTDSSGNGNNATYSGLTAPTLVSAVTPNSSSAVNVTGGDGSFVLASSLVQTNGYTVFAYVKPSSTSGRCAITGGSSSGALEYDIYNGKQNYLVEYTADVGSGTATVPTSSFSLINLAVNSSGAAFRFNGAPDGSVAGSTFTSPITRIGNNEGAGDGYVGQIAEVDIYNGVLSASQITNIEAQLTVKYGAASSVATNSTNITATVSGNLLTLTWPTDHIGWTLQAQTNSLSTGLGTNWVRISSSSTTNKVSVPIVPANGSVFYRLVYP